MDAVMLVEVLDDHGDVLLRQRISGVGARLQVGRSLFCDIPLDDPYVAPEHALLTLQEDGRVLVKDLGTRNGTRMGGKRIDAHHGRIISGGELLLGRTRLRVRTAEQQLTPERLFRRDVLQHHRNAIAITGVLLCLVFAAFAAWMRSPGEVTQGVVIAVLLAMVALGIWAGVWALVSRLTVGAWQLRVHLALASVCLALWGWGYWMYSLGAFALQWRQLGVVMTVLAGIVAWVIAWLHLHYATRLGRAAVLSLALLVPMLGGGLWWLVDLQLDPRTVNRVVQGPHIHPPRARVAASTDLGDFLTDVAELKREANASRQRSLLESPILEAND